MIYEIGRKTGPLRGLGKHQQKHGIFVVDAVELIEQKHVI
jgi:hypothetical protein